jgi:hypothetical protein
MRNGMDAWMYKNHRAENFLTAFLRYPSGRFEKKAAAMRIITLSAKGMLRRSVINSMPYDIIFCGPGQGLEKNFAAHELPGQLFPGLIKEPVRLPMLYEPSLEKEVYLVRQPSCLKEVVRD